MARYGPAPLPRLPLAPLLEATGLTGHELARELGKTNGEVYRAQHEGLTARMADEWACATGRHPITVWGEDWEVAAGGNAHGGELVGWDSSEWYASNEGSYPRPGADA